MSIYTKDNVNDSFRKEPDAGKPYVRSGFYVTENYCVMLTAEKSEK